MTFTVSQTLLDWVVGGYVGFALGMGGLTAVAIGWLTVQTRAYVKQQAFAEEASGFLELPGSGPAPAYAVYCMTKSVNDRLLVYRYLYWYYWRKRDALDAMKAFAALEREGGSVQRKWAHTVDRFLVAATYKDPFIVTGLLLRALWLPRHRRGEADTPSLTTQQAVLRTVWSDETDESSGNPEVPA